MIEEMASNDEEFDINELHELYMESRFPLFKACNDGRWREVDDLLQLGHDPNIRGKYGKSPLHYAIDNRICDPLPLQIVVDLLIQSGANVNAQDDKGTTCLLLACETMDIEMVQHLIDVGADVNIPNTTGKSPLYEVCRDVENWFFCHESRNDDIDSLDPSPWVDVCRSLLLAGADIHDATFLPTAVLFAQKELIKEMLALKMDVNMLDDNYRSSLVCASGSLSVGCDIVKILLDNNADVNQCQGGDVKPMQYAYSYFCVDKMKLLLSYGAKVTNEDMSELVSLTMSEAILQTSYEVTLDTEELVPWRLLTAAGARPHIQGELAVKILKLYSYPNYPEIKSWIWSLLGPLLSLKDCCRVEIRKHLSPIIDEKIEDLPLPTHLKNFLKFAEFPDVEIFKL